MRLSGLALDVDGFDVRPLTFREEERLKIDAEPLENVALAEYWSAYRRTVRDFEVLKQYCSLNDSLRIRIAGSRLLVGPRDLRIGYPDIFRFTPLGPKRPFRCGRRI